MNVWFATEEGEQFLRRVEDTIYWIPSHSVSGGGSAAPRSSRRHSVTSRPDPPGRCFECQGGRGTYRETPANQNWRRLTARGSDPVWLQTQRHTELPYWTQVVCPDVLGSPLHERCYSEVKTLANTVNRLPPIETPSIASP